MVTSGDVLCRLLRCPKGAGDPPAPGVQSEHRYLHTQAEGRSEHAALQGGMAKASLFP